jgi:hypothetical protein
LERAAFKRGQFLQGSIPFAFSYGVQAELARMEPISRLLVVVAMSVEIFLHPQGQHIPLL